MSDPAPPPELTARLRRRLDPLVALLADDQAAPSSVTAPAQTWKVHVADSLSGIGFEQLASATRICDIGAGAGFPGLVLATALPDSSVDLVEATGRKCEFIDRAIAALELRNARSVHARAEDWAAVGAEGREAYDAVTARAVARLSTLAELASPLLRPGGFLLAWKGRRDEEEEAELERAAAQLGVEPVEIRPVGPYAGSEHRHLHLIRKLDSTPADLPRRSGMAKKRPRGAQRP